MLASCRIGLQPSCSLSVQTIGILYTYGSDCHYMRGWGHTLQDETGITKYKPSDKTCILMQWDKYLFISLIAVRLVLHLSCSPSASHAAWPVEGKTPMHPKRIKIDLGNLAALWNGSQGQSRWPPLNSNHWRGNHWVLWVSCCPSLK